MSDKMTPLPFGQLMDRALTEYAQRGSVFGIYKLWRHNSGRRWVIFREQPELPFGPAAGPHTQMAQNLVAGYAAGGRFFELKTVQALDGEDLPVSKPCILAADEGYNVEWSTELTVPQAMDEYIKGWFACKLLSRELGLGGPDGFVFNMSVGYDLAGLQTGKIDSFIEGLKNAGRTEAWQTCRQWALEHPPRFKHVDRAYIDGINPRVCRSVTLSTLHGCPPDEIERIAAYLLSEKGLHTFVKLNPTLLGYEYARKTLDSLGYGDVAFDDRHFKADPQFGDAVPMLRRLTALAGDLSLTFGVKLTNTFPVQITDSQLPGDEMYMSGRALFPLSIEVARQLSEAFGGTLRVSFSGGADARNIASLVDAGIWPVTLATTLLKPGGYARLYHMAELLSGCEAKPFTGIDMDKLRALAEAAASDPLYRKAAIRPAVYKTRDKLPVFDCYKAPCRDGCPFHQDIPAYLRLAGEGRHAEAMRVITQRNPLPFTTGTICPHRCADKCTRQFYDRAVDIRAVKLEAAHKGYAQYMRETETVPKSGEKVAVIGGGPAGLAAAYFLSRAGCPVTLFEKRDSLGGVVRHVIPDFRIGGGVIDRDIALIKAMGAEFRLNSEISDLDALRGEGFRHIIIAVGAWKPGVLPLENGAALDVLVFLEQFKRDPPSALTGRNVAVIGGGNTAVDAARAAIRARGVERVSLIYRRTRRYMPADAGELELALADGVTFHELLSPVSLRDGALTCMRMELVAPDTSGRRRPAATGETVCLPADTVIAAVGSRVDEALYAGWGIVTDAGGRALTNDDTGETNLPGVYVIGDARRGPATVAEAIADALRCAEAIAGADAERYAGLNVNPVIQAARDKKGILYHDGAPVHESVRCLECATLCENCVDVCPNRANVAEDVDGRAQINHLDALCNECGNCETFCPYGEPSGQWSVVSGQ